VGRTLAEALNKKDINAPAAVQAEVIPQALKGRDIIAVSPTGTGKTLAYLLPVFHSLSASPETVKRVQALVLVPTYELAAQVQAVSRELWEDAGYPGAKPVLLVGGAGIERQIAALKEKPRVVIGSPGRVAELIKLKKLTVHFVKTVVLDECDRLIDKNNLEHVRAVLKPIPRERQMLLFSATAKEKSEVLNSFARDPLYIRIGETVDLTHRATVCERRDKFSRLRGLIHMEKIEKALLFVTNSGDACRAAERLNFHGVKTAALSAVLAGAERKTAINRLRDGKITVLAATDAAARGLDIQGLTHVINMEPPHTAEEYLHRAGRTGRMGRPGTAVTLVTENEKVRLEAIAKTLGIIINYKN